MNDQEPLLRGLSSTTTSEQSSNLFSHFMQHAAAEDTRIPTSAPSNAPTPLATHESSVLALTLPRISALLSLLAVLCVAVEAWHDFRADRRRRQGDASLRANRKVATVTHIQLFFQIPLFCQAVALGMGTNPVPSYLDVWGAMGGTASCDLQGFLVQFSMIGSVGWDMALSAVYLLMVRYNVRSTRLQGYLKYYHMVIWPTALAMSLYPLTQGMYNYNTTVCWLETYPNECVGDECLRGQNAPTWQTITSLVAIVHFLFSILVMISLYCTVRRLTRTPTPTSSTLTASTAGSKGNGARKINPTQQRTSADYSRAIGIQGILYASGIMISVLPSVILILLWNVAGIWSEGFSIFATATTPLMGYANFVIFMRGRRVSECHTRYARFLRRIHGWMFDRSWIRSICGIWGLLCCCSCHCNIEWTGPRLPQNRQGDVEDPDMTASATHRLQQSSDFRLGLVNTTSTSGLTQSNRTGLTASTKDQPPPLDEPNAVEGEMEDAVSPNGLKKWVGYLISWKSRGKGDAHLTTNSSQMVSALGCESVGSPNRLSYDFPPSHPRQQRSNKGQLPPVLPTRAPTQVDSDSSDSESSEEEILDPLDQSGRSTEDRLPPVPSTTKRPASLQFSLGTALESFAGPPVTTKKKKSKRPSFRSDLESSLVSEITTLEEIEDWHFSGQSSQSLLVPPTLPQRLASEVEPLTSDDDSSSRSLGSQSATVGKDPQKAEAKAAQAAAPTRPIRLASEAEALTDVESSELSDTNSEGSEQNARRIHKSMIASQRRQGDHVPPVPPTRFLPDKEEDHQEAEAKAAQAAAPTHPIRLASEAEVLTDVESSELSDTNSERSEQSAIRIHESMVANQRRRCDHVPPVPPIRFVSEAEGGLSDSDSVCSVATEDLKEALGSRFGFQETRLLHGVNRFASDTEKSSSSSKGGAGEQIPPAPPVRFTSEAEGFSELENESS